FFKHYRKVEHRDGTTSMKTAPLKKNIYSLNLLCELLLASNQRYLRFISAFEDTSLGIEKLKRITETFKENTQSYKGFNFFNQEDLDLLLVLASGEFNISGFNNKQLRKKLPSKTSSQISRILKRLHTHGLIKKIGRTYKYYLSNFGMQIITLGLKIRELFVIPNLSVSV
ncbi:MAG: MarR family transcriptional regulator, partial [FCB group bacterium]|nr:MarR family transcriptional regulator [FCB group bacterium]